MNLLPAYTESTITDLVHQARLTGKQMMRTHLKDDILAFVRIAIRLQEFGFRLQWVKHKGAVGITRTQGGPHVIVGVATKPNPISSSL